VRWNPTGVRYVDGGSHSEFVFLSLFFHPVIFPFNADALLSHFERCALYKRGSYKRFVPRKGPGSSFMMKQFSAAHAAGVKLGLNIEAGLETIEVDIDTDGERLNKFADEVVEKYPDVSKLVDLKY